MNTNEPISLWVTFIDFDLLELTNRNWSMLVHNYSNFTLQQSSYDLSPGLLIHRLCFDGGESNNGYVHSRLCVIGGTLSHMARRSTPGL